MGSMAMEWIETDGKLRRTYAFRTFRKAMAFMLEVAFEAEKMNHHPEWSNSYGRVDVALVTHDAREITDLDHLLAARMDEIAATHLV